MDAAPPKPSYLEFPVEVRPRLSDARVHHAFLTNAALEITTLPDDTNFLTLLAIPHVRVLQARFIRGFLGDSFCQIVYRDENDQQKAIKLAILEPDHSAPNVRQTWAFAQTLQQVHTGKPISHADVTSNPNLLADNHVRLFFGVIALFYVLGPAVAFGLPGLLFSGILGLTAIVLYRLHHHYHWPPAVKMAFATLLFFVALMSMIAIFGFLDMNR
jgi:hypothetical protein